MNQPHTPRKRFGQNFLIDNNVIQNIVRALHPLSEQNIVEIGPGLGALTKEILGLIPHLHVIEIDHDLSARLQSIFSTSQITVHECDALDFDFSSLLNSPHQKLRVFGNLPYNVSTPLLFHLLQYNDVIQDMLFMLQKEVITRMAAKPNSKDYGRLSV
ncbi:MAG: 16S rRNA (adenine(1518)-N(6)/adenine(1519)-N(6))-dimethyltransferase RsmA, partial [Candidatus Berkiella sp.]